MPIIVSNSTIDVITRGLIKYRLCTHAAANTVGAELIRVNHLAVNHATVDGVNPVEVNLVAAEFCQYDRRPFERKVKRIALDGAIRCYLTQVEDYDLADIMPVIVLVKRLAERNAVRMGETDSPGGLGYGDVEDTDEGRAAVMIRTREEREEANRIILQERMAAIAAERAANPTSSDDEDYGDEDDFDDDDVDGDY